MVSSVPGLGWHGDKGLRGLCGGLLPLVLWTLGRTLTNTACPVPMPRRSSPPQVMALLTTPLQPLLGASLRQVGAFLVVMFVGVTNVYLK